MAQQFDVVVVGGGLAGLAAAATAARSGRTVALLDARGELGGRARSIRVDGFALNEGPHALYRGGAGIGVLAGLGVHPTGHTPSFRHARGVRHRQLVGPLSGAAVAGMGRFDLAAALGPGAARRAEGRTTAEWIELVARADARDALAALVRVSSYVGDHDRLDATPPSPSCGAPSETCSTSTAAGRRWSTGCATPHGPPAWRSCTARPNGWRPTGAPPT
jgi:phytoene dehydrogenase-like protein